MSKLDKPEVRLSIVTSLDITRWAFGQRILTLFCDADLRLMPERVGYSEPIKTPVLTVEDCEKHWAIPGNGRGPEGPFYFHSNFFWKRTKVIRSAGCMFHTSKNKFGTLLPRWLTFTATPDRRVDWHRLFQQLCALTEPKFASLHLRTSTETRPGAFSPEIDENYGTNDYLNGIPDAALKGRGLANLSWATFFGKEYAAEVDVEKLSAHGFNVEKIGEGFFIVASPALFDVMDDFALFSARRSLLKNLFRQGLFRVNEEPKILAD